MVGVGTTDVAAGVPLLVTMTMTTTVTMRVGEGEGGLVETTPCPSPTSPP